MCKLTCVQSQISVVHKSFGYLLDQFLRIINENRLDQTNSDRSKFKFAKLYYQRFRNNTETHENRVRPARYAPEHVIISLNIDFAKCT